MSEVAWEDHAAGLRLAHVDDGYLYFEAGSPHLLFQHRFFVKLCSVHGRRPEVVRLALDGDHAAALGRITWEWHVENVQRAKVREHALYRLTMKTKAGEARYFLRVASVEDGISPQDVGLTFTIPDETIALRRVKA